MRAFAERAGLRRPAARSRVRRWLGAVDARGCCRAVGSVGKAAGRAVSRCSTSVVLRGAARSPFCVRPPPHASVARRQLVRALRRQRARSFRCLLPPLGFLPLSPREGARFAAGFARRGCGLPRLVFCSLGGNYGDLTRAARVKSANSRVKCGF